MINLNGTNQYAYWDGLAGSVQGVPNFAQLGTLIGWPQWWCADFLPTSIALNRFMLGLQQRTGAGRQSMQLNAATLQLNNGTTGMSPKSGIVTTGFQRMLMCIDSRTSATLYVDGVAAATAVNDNPFPQGVDTLVIGARWESNVAADLFFSGSLANVAFGNGKPSAAQRTGCIVGVNPLSLPGCVRYYPLLADATDFFGCWNLTTSGSPTFTSVGHPTVSTYPPGGVSGSRIFGGF